MFAPGAQPLLPGSGLDSNMIRAMIYVDMGGFDRRIAEIDRAGKEAGRCDEDRVRREDAERGGINGAEETARLNRFKF